MNEKNEIAQEEKNINDVIIVRGRAIYNEWKKCGLSSRKIVKNVECAVAAMHTKKNSKSCVEALSYLFALDMRIKEKYNTFLRCIFSYFSWRRETNALNKLKGIFHISESEDIRTAIEVELQRLRENLEAEESEEADDETHGGKRNSKSEEEAIAAEEKEMEETAEKKTEAEDIPDKEETKEDAEQKEDISIEEPLQEEVTKEIVEKEEFVELKQKETDGTVVDKKEELAQEKNENIKEEYNVSDNISETSTDKKEEAKSYNDAVDSPPLYEESPVSERPDKKMSFIDEMIIDNMVKGDKSIIGYQRIDEAERIKNADIQRDTVSNQDNKNKSTDKNAYLYDKTLANDKGQTHQPGKIESTQQTEKVSQIRTEQPKETTQKNDNVQSTEQKNRTQESTPLREKLQVDIDVTYENKVAKELNDTMSLESKLSYIRMQEDMLREQISISNKELGIDDRAGVLGISEPEQINQPSIAPNRK